MLIFVPIHSQETAENEKAVQEQASKDLAITKVVRFEVGEGIEKKEENFAEEVAAQLKK